MTAKLCAVVLLLACAWQGSYAWRHLFDDYRYSLLRAELSFWGAERYTPTGLTRARTAEGTARLVVSAPCNADYWNLRAGQQAWEAWWASGETATRKHTGQTLEAYRQSLRCRPAHADTWSQLEHAATVAGDETLAEQTQAALAGLRMTPN